MAAEACEGGTRHGRRHQPTHMVCSLPLDIAVEAGVVAAHERGSAAVASSSTAIAAAVRMMVRPLRRGISSSYTFGTSMTK